MKRHKYIFSIFCIFAMIFLLPAAYSASADFAPKPSVEVHVINAPEGDYLIDILVENETSIERPEPFNQDNKMEMTIRAYNQDGFHARCEGLMGLDDYTLIYNNDEDIYKFSYTIPNRFRMIIVTEDGKTLVSSTLSPILYQTTVTFDAVSGSLTESASAAGSKIVASIKAMWPNFGITLGMTVVIEGVIMALFFLKWKWHGWLKFILTQILTQALLYLFLQGCAFFGALYVFKFFIGEIGVIIIEAAIYDRFIETEHRGRQTFAAILANIASAAPFILLPQLYNLLPMV